MQTHKCTWKQNITSKNKMPANQILKYILINDKSFTDDKTWWWTETILFGELSLVPLHEVSTDQKQQQPFAHKRNDCLSHVWLQNKREQRTTNKRTIITITSNELNILKKWFRETDVPNHDVIFLNIDNKVMRKLKTTFADDRRRIIWPLE